jgi:hypothetical protein
MGIIMGVILDCRPGDEIICIGEFHASPAGGPFSWDTSRNFHVGDRLRYVGLRQNTEREDSPNSWLVLFKGDMKQYAATQTYFVTIEEWDAIEKYFARREPPSLPLNP